MKVEVYTFIRYLMKDAGHEIPPPQGTAGDMNLATRENERQILIGCLRERQILKFHE